MRIGRPTFLAGVLLWCVTASAQILHNQAADFELSVTPRSTSLSRLEPLEVQVSVKNIRDEERVLKAHGALAMDLTLTHVMPSGIRLKSEGPVWARAYDFHYSLREVTLQPGEVFTQPLLLNEWFTAFSEGHHIFEIGWGEHAPISATFDIGPRDESRLRRTIDDLIRQVQLPVQSIEDLDRYSQALLKLRYIRDDLKLPALIELSKNSKVGLVAAELLEEFDRPEAVNAIAAVGRRDPYPGSVRRSLLAMRDRSTFPGVREMIDELLAAISAGTEQAGRAGQ